MDRDQVDAVLISLVQHRWQKVAMVIALALKELGQDDPSSPAWLPDRDRLFGEILQRVAALVEIGALEAQGDISLPRHCEIRLPGGGGCGGRLA